MSNCLRETHSPTVSRGASGENPNYEHLGGVDPGEVEVIVRSADRLSSESETLTAIAPTPFVVNTIRSGVPDFDLDDGLCDVDAGEPGQQCTLSAAAANANLTPEIAQITFNIPGDQVAGHPRRRQLHRPGGPSAAQHGDLTVTGDADDLRLLAVSMGNVTVEALD